MLNLAAVLEHSAIVFTENHAQGIRIVETRY
jgi:hypothetical protein